jgi:hypothetical protein
MGSEERMVYSTEKRTRNTVTLSVSISVCAGPLLGSVHVSDIITPTQVVGRPRILRAPDRDTLLGAMLRSASRLGIDLSVGRKTKAAIRYVCVCECLRE